MAVYVDERADDRQREALGAVLSGEQGGPPEMLAGLVGEQLGVKFVPISFTSDRDRKRVEVPGIVEFEVEGLRAPGSPAVMESLTCSTRWAPAFPSPSPSRAGTATPTTTCRSTTPAKSPLPRVRLAGVARAALWAGLLVVAGFAWVLLIRQSPGMPAPGRARGCVLGEFLLLWVVMMAAMMLPSVAPVASMYLTVLRTAEAGAAAAHAAALVAGYLLAWAGFGVVAFGISWALGKLVPMGMGR